MSKIALQGNASGTGTITIASQNTNSNYTLTLPNATGTVLTSASTSGFPAGTVLQVAQAYKTDTQTISSGVPTFVDIVGLTLTLTPASTSSKFLIQYVVNIGNGLDASHGYVRLYRNGVAIANADAAGSRTVSPSAVINTAVPGQTIPSVGCYLDSPATSSAITYKLVAANNSTGTSSTFINRSSRDNNSQDYDGRSCSSIIVMEIAG